MSEIDERALKAAHAKFIEAVNEPELDGDGRIAAPGDEKRALAAAILAYDQHRGKQEPVGAESEVRLHNAAVFEACRHWPATNRGVSYREAFIQGAQWARERYADVGALREAAFKEGYRRARIAARSGEQDRPDEAWSEFAALATSGGVE